MAELERAVAQQVSRLDHRLMTKRNTEIDDVRAAWPVPGLARRFPAQDLGTLQTLLQEYAYRLPGDLPHGVDFVLEGGPADDFDMATNGKGGFWFREIEHGTFNSRRDRQPTVAGDSGMRVGAAGPRGRPGDDQPGGRSIGGHATRRDDAGPA